MLNIMRGSRWIFKFCLRLIISLQLLILIACANQATYLNMRLEAAHFLNPNIKGQASPLSLTIYQLSNDKHFKQLSYSELTANDGEAVGSSLLDQQQIVLKPNEQRDINIKLSQEAQFIAVVAHYRAAQKNNWRHIINLASNKSRNIILSLNSYSIHMWDKP